MKFIHTSDWHIGQEFRGFSRLDEHRYFITQLCDLAKKEKPDALLVSGDVYDTKIPTAAAQSELVRSIVDLRNACPEMAIVVTAGNHDSGARIDSHRPLWQAAGVQMIGTCQRDDNDIFDPRELIYEIPGKGIIIAAPYFYQRNFPVTSIDIPIEKRQREFFSVLGAEAEAVNAGRGLPVVMMAHLSIDGCDFKCHPQSTIGGIKAEKAEEMGTGFDYLAMGHIHKPQTLRKGTGTIRYSGSPYPMSFSEDFPHSVSIVEISGRKAAPQVREAEIKPLRNIVTFEPEDGKFNSAVDIARQLPLDDESYVRLIIKKPSEPILEPMQEAAKLLEDTKLRLCSVEIAADNSTIARDAGGNAVSFDIDEFRKLSPVELVEKIQETKAIDGLPEDWREMLEEACEETRKQMADQ